MENNTVPEFTSLQLPDALKKALARLNFQSPTPIQAQTLPAALEGKDVIGCAQTGTGKTGAFVIPLVAKLMQNPDHAALIMTPTRELAMQVHDVVRGMTFFERKLNSALLIGGASYGPQFRDLRQNPRIVIGTPGRLQDHLDQGSLQLKKTSVLVLDEADRMLDMGFAPQIEEILKSVPKDRQTFLFTATLPKEIERMAQKILREPVRVMVGGNSKPIEKIKQEVIETREDAKLETLINQINSRQGSVLVFAKTKRRTDRLSLELADSGYDVVSIHGDRSQRQRSDAIRDFKKGYARILVATDVAARGLDVPHIAHVINFDLPQVPEDFIHRIGRTARAGAEGNALTFVTPAERGMWKRIQRLISGGPSQEESTPGAHHPRQGRPFRKGGFQKRRPQAGGGGEQRRPQGNRRGGGPAKFSSLSRRD